MTCAVQCQLIVLRRTQKICRKHSHNISVSPHNPATFLRGPGAHDCEPPNSTPGTLMRKKPIPSFPCESSFHAGGHAPVHHSLIYHVRGGTPYIPQGAKRSARDTTLSPALSSRQPQPLLYLYCRTWRDLRVRARLAGLRPPPPSPTAGVAPGLAKPEYGDTITL